MRDAGNRSNELETLNGNGVVPINHNSDYRKDNNFEKVGSYGSPRLGIQEINSLPETSYNRCADGSWDLDANVAEPKSFFHENKLIRFHSRMNVFGFFNNLWAAYGSRVVRNYIKKLKDGEEQRDSPSATDTSNDAQV